MKQLKADLYDLLNIQAKSGQEEKVSSYLIPKLEKLMDKVFLDDYENLLAEKKCGDQPITILLSAHMDTVSNIHPDRKVYEKNGVFHSTKGILGADDRAGIAIILTVLRNLYKTNFQGTIKVAFCREEEIGCVGSSQIDPAWVEDANLAIVVDRRGSHDIVTSCGGYLPFCSESVGDFFEKVSEMLGFDYKVCEGGLSDTSTFARWGINGVNLSAGYFNEHTEREYLVTKYARKTVNLILKALMEVHNYVDTFGKVPEGDGYDYGYYSNYYSSTYYSGSGKWNDEEEYGNWWKDQPIVQKDNSIKSFYGRDSYYGHVDAVSVDGYVYIRQQYKDDEHELFMPVDEFDDLVVKYLQQRQKERDKERKDLKTIAY